MSCLSDVKAWLSLNFLNFNESKTETIVFGPSDSRSTPVDSSVIFDDGLKFDKQINTVVKSCFVQL